VEAFWQRRNPDPDAPDNALEIEHYRRIAYSDEHFTMDAPGWKSDRGRMYITWGPPDGVEDGVRGTERWQIWRYRYLEGIGENVELSFEDADLTGDYRLSSGLPREEERFSKETGHPVSHASWCERAHTPEPRPPAKFKSLEKIAFKQIPYRGLTLNYRADSTPVTEFMTLVSVTIETPKSDFAPTNPQPRKIASLDLLCRIADATGRVVGMFETHFLPEYPSKTFADSGDFFVLQKSLPLRPGFYDVSIVVNETSSHRFGTVFNTLNVPNMAAK